MPTPIDLRNLKGRVPPALDPSHELPAPEHEELLAAPEHDGASENAADAFPEALFLWEAPEFDHTAESATYLTMVSIFLAAGGIIALLFKNYLFGAFLLLAGMLVFVYSRRHPRIMTIAVTGRGITVGRTHHDFDQLKSFWLSYDPPLFKELVLGSKAMFAPTIRIPLGDADPVELREVLVGFLKEERRDETLIDILAKRVGF